MFCLETQSKPVIYNYPHSINYFTVQPNDNIDIIVSTYSDSTIKVLDNWNNVVLYYGKDTTEAIKLIMCNADNHVSVHLAACFEANMDNEFAISVIYQCIQGAFCEWNKKHTEKVIALY